MKSLWPWIKHLIQRKGRLALGATLLLVTVMASVALLGLSGWFITATGLTAVLLAAGFATYLDVYVPGAGIRAFALTRTLARYLERLYNHDTILRLLADLRLTLFERLSQANPLLLNRKRSSQWLNRLTQDVDTLDNLYLRLLAPPVVALLSSLLVVIVVSFWLPGAALGLLVLLLLLLTLATLVPALLGAKQGHISGMARETLRLEGIDHLDGLAELSAAHKTEDHRQRLWQSHHSLQKAQRSLALLTATMQSLCNALLAMAIVMLLIFGILGFQAGAISGPLLVMMVLATLALNEAFANLPKAFADLGSTVLAAQRLNDLQAMPGAALSAGQSLDQSAALSCEELTFHHGGEPVLDKINLSLNQGDWAVVTGPSGRGKSTLAALIAGLHRPDSGTVLRYGKAPASWPQPEGQTDLAWLTQDTQLFSDTVANNLLLAKPEATDRELWAVLEWVELADRLEQTGLGLDTWVGEGGLALSGGEQRRLALARVMLHEASLVLLDEPFRGLDEATALRLLRRLERWGQSRTLIWFAHEQSILPASAHILRL